MAKINVIKLNREKFIGIVKEIGKFDLAKTEKLEDLGMVRVGTPDVVGKYTNDIGTALAIFTEEGYKPIYAIIRPGTPKEATLFMISTWKSKEEFTNASGKVVPAGTISFKATAVVEEKTAE